MSNDLTVRLLLEASQPPFGDHVKRVVKAAPAKTISEDAQHVIDDLNARDHTMGFISKVLAYSRLFTSNKQHSIIIRLLKGGFLQVEQIDAPPPDGSAARRDDPYGKRYFAIVES